MTQKIRPLVIDASTFADGLVLTVENGVAGWSALDARLSELVSLAGTGLVELDDNGDLIVREVGSGDGAILTKTAADALYAQIAHLHELADINGLSDILDAKVDESSLSLATTSASGFMSASDKTKLDTVQSGATANSTDAFLLNRANHTGTQAQSTVTGLETALAAKLPTSALSTFGLNFVGLVDAAAARTNLSLGSAALSDSSSFAPATHGHTIGEITNLSATLSSLAPLSAPSFTDGVSVAGNVTSTTGFFVGANRVLTEADALDADTLDGLDSTAFATAGHTHFEFTTLTTSLAGKEPTITAGTTSQYWRGDKSWQNLDKAAVGLSNVDDTSDLNKPVSNATQAALDAKANLSSPDFTGTPTVDGETLWHSGNDGVGSGLDADTLDGLQAAAFSLAGHTHDYAPTVHAHDIADVTGLQGALDAKAALSGATFTGDVTLAQDPTDALHAATKQYVDNSAFGINAKDAVKAATTTNMVLSAEQVVDGIALTTGDRVLVKNQTDPIENGIYVVDAAAWSRSADYDEWSEVSGAFTFVEEGTTQAGSSWLSQAGAGTTMDADPITWVQFSDAGNYQAGSGLTLSGSIFSLAAIASGTLLGNLSGATAVPQTLTPTEVTASLDVFTSGLKGLAPASGGGTTNFLRADGTWSAPVTSWGQIAGTLTNQADLVSALAAKAPLNNPIFTGDVTVGERILATSSSQHRIGNLVIANGGNGTPVLKSFTESNPLQIGSGLRFYTTLAAKLEASSAVAANVEFNHNTTNYGFVWRTAPVTNNTLVDAMRLDHLGNLGLGKTPTARLDVQGDAKVSGSLTAQGVLYSEGKRVWRADDSLDATTLDGLDSTAFAPVTHSHEIDDINGLQAALDSKMDGVHTHEITDVTGLQAALDAKEAVIAAGSTNQYWRGDKTWQTLDKGAVGLSNVNNTSDADKPVSTATASALAGKLPLSGGTLTGALTVQQAAPLVTLLAGTDTDLTSGIEWKNNLSALQARIGFNADEVWQFTNSVGSIDLSGTTVTIGGNTAYHAGNLTKATIGLGNVNNTSDADKPVSTAQQSALDLKLDATHEGSGGATHAEATTTVAGFMSSTDKTKLDGIAAGATANSTDTYLRARSNHTGTQEISTISGLQAALDNKATAGPVTTSGITMTTARLLGRTSASAGVVEELTAGSGITISNGAIASYVANGTFGDIDVTGSTWTVRAGRLTNDRFVNMAANTIKGRLSTSGIPQDLTGANINTILPAFTTSTKGLVPASGASTELFLKGDGTWAQPEFVGGEWGELSGTLSDQTDLWNALEARQPLDSTLSSIAALTTSADTIAYFDGAASSALAPFTATGRAIVGASDGSAARGTIGLGNVDNTSDLDKPVSTAQQAALDGKLNTSALGQPNGVASLDGSGKLVIAQLPALAISEVTVVADETEQLALDSQSGDIAVRSDESKTYIHNGGTNGDMTDWTELSTTGQVLSVNGQTGIVVLSKSDVGLSNVDNTSDLDKPISTAVQTALDTHGHDVATQAEDGFLSAADKTKLDGVDNRANHTGTQSFSTITQTGGTLLGRSTAGNGATEEISLSAGFELTGGQLSLTRETFDPIVATGTGSAQIITLPNSNLTADDLLVSFEGLTQAPEDLDVNGANLTITAPAGAKVVVRYANIGALGRGPSYSAILNRNSAQPCSSGVETALTFNEIEKVAGGVTGVPVSTIAMPAGSAGHYTLSATVQIEGSTGGTRRSVIIYVNGEMKARTDMVPAAFDQYLNVSTGVYLTGGDNVEVKLYHDGGFVLNALGDNTKMSLIRISP